MELDELFEKSDVISLHCPLFPETEKIINRESIAKMKAQVEANGMVFDVVESIPVHEDIKLGRGDVDKLLDVYCENIRRCAKYGVKCVTYNFMPVFDWTRTQLDKTDADGSTSLVMYWEQMKGLDPLKDDIHLPGWDSSYTQDEVRELIQAYGELGSEGLWANLEKFLKKVIPVAEECGVRMMRWGRGSNVLFPDAGLDALVISTEKMDEITSPEPGMYVARAGATLNRLALAACRDGYTGLEFAHGIPGSVLGAMTGAIITEAVYVVPGAGGLLTDAINQYNNNVIIGLVLFYSLLSVTSLILGDVLMSTLDPRISFTTKAR